MAELEGSSDSVEILRRYLLSKGEKFGEIVGRTAFEVARPGEYDAKCYYQLFSAQNQFVFYVIAIMQVPQENLAGVAEYFTWVNSGLRIASFELDHRDGTMRCRSAFDFSGMPLPEALVGNAAKRALEAYDRYIEGAVRVVAGLSKPLEALTRIDGPQ
jgi:hypothetical protein